MNDQQTYLKAAAAAAATRTYRLASRFGLSREDREDLQQDLLLDLLERAPQFNPAKASAATFTGLVSGHRAVEWLDRWIKDRSRRCFFSVFEPVGDPDGGEATDVVDGIEADDRDLFSDSETLRDIETAVAYLNDEQAALFALLEVHQDLPCACRASGTSTATFYRRVADLRMHLRMFGFKPAI